MIALIAAILVGFFCKRWIHVLIGVIAIQALSVGFDFAVRIPGVQENRRLLGLQAIAPSDYISSWVINLILMLAIAFAIFGVRIWWQQRKIPQASQTEV
jgi:hypothetical protein